jgi:predicted dehydrogenase
MQRIDLLATWPRRAGYFTSAPWRGTWKGEGGGVLINQGQHDLDVLCYVAGQPSRIVAWRRTQLHAIETEDTVSAMVEWPSGATGFIHISTAESDEEQRLEVTGTGGRLRLTKGRLKLIRNEVDVRDYAVSPGNPYEAPPVLDPEIITGEDVSHPAIYRDLVAARAEGREPVAPGHSALATLELTNALTYSAMTGQEVRMPLDRAAYGRLLRSLRGE